MEQTARRFAIRCALGPLVIGLAIASGCAGGTTGAVDISRQADGSYSARLTAKGSCDQRCFTYMRWRRIGAQEWSNAPSFEVPGPATNATWSQGATGLVAGEEYEYQVCGKEASMSVYVCAGPDGANSSQQFTASEGSVAEPGWFASHTESQQQAIVNFFYAISAQGIIPYSGQPATEGQRLARDSYLEGTGPGELVDGIEFATQAFNPLTKAGISKGLPGIAQAISVVDNGLTTGVKIIKDYDGMQVERYAKFEAIDLYAGGGLGRGVTWRPYGSCVGGCNPPGDPQPSVQQWPGAYVFTFPDSGAAAYWLEEPPGCRPPWAVPPDGARLQGGLTSPYGCVNPDDGQQYHNVPVAYAFLALSDFRLQGPIHPYDPATDPAPDVTVRAPDDPGVAKTRPAIASDLNGNDRALLRAWLDWQLEPARQPEEKPTAIGLPPKPKQADSCVAASTPNRRDPGKNPPNYSSGDPRAQIRQSFTNVYNPITRTTQAAKLYWGTQQGFGERHIQSAHGWGANDISQTQLALSQPDARVPDPNTNTTWRYYRFFTGSNGTTNCTRRVVVNFGNSDDNFPGSKNVITSFAYPTTAADPAPGTFR